MIILYLLKHFEIELGSLNILHVNASTAHLSLPFFLLILKSKMI